MFSSVRFTTADLDAADIDYPAILPLLLKLLPSHLITDALVCDQDGACWRAQARSADLPSSYSWHRKTREEAVCLAILNANNILECTDIRELSCRQA